MHLRGVHQAQLTLLLAAVMGCSQVLDQSVSLASERTSIERTYELTKYLDHQLKEIRDTYLSYLGPPFSDRDFSPPRPNSSSLSLPSAATRVDLWRGLENGVRLAQNQRAYTILLCAVKELASSTLCPYLQSSLLHFCSGLSGLLGAISGLMNTLGYTPPSHGNIPPLQGYATPLLHSPAPLRSHSARNHVREEPARMETERRRERERERGEKGRRGRRREGDSWVEGEEEELTREGGAERWGRRRRLLSFDEEENKKTHYDLNVNNNNNHHRNHIIHTFNATQHNSSKDITVHPYTKQGSEPYREREQGMSREKEGDKVREPVSLLLYSSPSLHSRRLPRSLPSPSPPLSAFSLLYKYGGGVTEGHTLMTTPIISAAPAPNDFSRKVEGFWVLRELQSWLQRSAKDFNRLKKRLRA